MSELSPFLTQALLIGLYAYGWLSVHPLWAGILIGLLLAFFIR
jgi:hypothetical protein